MSPDLNHRVCDSNAVVGACRPGSAPTRPQISGALAFSLKKHTNKKKSSTWCCYESIFGWQWLCVVVDTRLIRVRLLVAIRFVVGPVVAVVSQPISSALRQAVGPPRTVGNVALPLDRSRASEPHASCLEADDRSEEIDRWRHSVCARLRRPLQVQSGGRALAVVRVCCVRR